MIEVHEADSIILNHLGDFGITSIPLDQSVNRILKENWVANRDLPPYDRITMDGIAIRFEDYDSGARSFVIAGIAPAGMEQQTLLEANTCFEVMTGTILPKGTDTVIRYEDLDISDSVAKCTVNKVLKGQNIHYKGEDHQVGNTLVVSGQRISAAEIGIGASIGQSIVQVAKMPRIMVLSTGDELVPIEEQPLPHQIRRSNVYRLRSSLHSHGISADEDHLPDKKSSIRQKLRSYIEEYDVIMLSGGVSKGKFDFLPEVLEEIGVTKQFHKILQRPGKPFWFGTYKNQCTVFALPGNPISSFLCMQRYFLMWLYTSLGKPMPKVYGILSEDVNFKPDLTYFLEVALEYGLDGRILATPKKGHGSGDLANLKFADAFMELPMGRDQYYKGEVYPIHQYRQ